MPGGDAATTSPGRVREVRGDVQALRAVAVAAVVLYHLWPAELPGGFVGVDVFFVISGFLITRQLADELAHTGRISLTQFWARRIRRLLPAAFTVLAACLATLVLLMPVLTWRQNVQEIRAAAAYGENWLLGAHAVDYLAAEDSASLVQHYWSLSVEEQFYLLWPLLMLVGLVLCRVVRPERRRLTQLGLLVVVTVASFVVSVRFTAADPALAFFATPTRAWEFAAGGLVAVAAPGDDSHGATAARALVAWSGLGLIGYSTLAISGNDPFPGSVALLPVTGASLVLAARAPVARWSPGSVAGLRPVQWLGNHSYSVYLWHWPLIVAAPWVLHGPASSGSRVVIAVASLALAWVTKRYVEDPVRAGRAWRSRRWPAYGLALTGLAMVVAATSFPAARVARVEAAVRSRVAAQDQEPVPAPVASEPTGRRARDPAPAVPVVTHASCEGAAAMDQAHRCARPYARPHDLDTAFAAADGRSYVCLQGTGASVPQLCAFGRTDSPRHTIAVVGNSHAARLVPALDLYGRQHGWQVLLAAKIDCMGLATSPIGAQTAGEPCVRWSAALQRRLLSMSHLDAVVFASHIGARTYLAGPNPSHADVRTAQERVLATWTALVRRGVHVIVTEDVPGMRPDPDPECIARSGARYDPCAVDRSAVVKPNLMTDLAQQHPRLARYEPLTQFFCDAKRCHGLIGGDVVYYDSHHLTTTYSRSLAPYLGADVDAVLTAHPGDRR